nr:transglycosylase family protein [Actinomycetota bacterium]
MPKRALAITAVLVTTSALVPPPKVKARTEPPTPPVPALDETLASLELPSRPPVPDPAPPVAVDPPGVMVGEPTSAGGGQGPAGGRNAANRPGRMSRSGDPLARIRACESGSNYQARSPSGRYGGAYQMDRATFASV